MYKFISKQNNKRAKGATLIQVHYLLEICSILGILHFVEHTAPLATSYF